MATTKAETIIDTNVPASSEPVTPSSRPIILPSSPSSDSLVFLSYEGPDITDNLLTLCANLFGHHYGVWGDSPSTGTGRRPKRGSRVKMSAARLRSQCVAAPESTILTVCYLRSHDCSSSELELVGHAFGTVWDYSGGRVGWITQLVVNLNARKRYIATQLLQMIKKSPLFQSITCVGLVSSHPSACHILAKFAEVSIQQLDLSFCAAHAHNILVDSPVDYVRNMELRGSLFNKNDDIGAVSSVFTDFWVDHDEPLLALATYRSRGPWPLGDLLEGHEFIVILPINVVSTLPDVFR